MNLRRNALLFTAALSLVGLSLGSLPARGEDKPKAAAKTAAPAGTPSPEQMMKAWRAAGTPGEAHIDAGMSVRVRPPPAISRRSPATPVSS